MEKHNLMVFYRIVYNLLHYVQHSIYDKDNSSELLQLNLSELSNLPCCQTTCRHHPGAKEKTEVILWTMVVPVLLLLAVGARNR